MQHRCDRLLSRDVDLDVGAGFEGSIPMREREAAEAD
jgi:hypothetical protein